MFPRISASANEELDDEYLFTAKRTLKHVAGRPAMGKTSATTASPGATTGVAKEDAGRYVIEFTPPLVRGRT